jgi:response regulator RpfG family c-di-GMP phosphodiesterase
VEQVLLVDDEPYILAGYQRQLRNQFNIETALGAEEALGKLCSGGPFAVVVSDLRMPGINGIEFLARVRSEYPVSIRIMLTGNADLDSAVKAINEGSIFRFLTKPCPPDMLAMAIVAGLEQYRLVQSEKELLEKTLSGSVKLLSEILALASPAAYGRAARVRRTVRQLAAGMRLVNTWVLDLAAMLSHVGCIAIPDDILRRVSNGQSVSDQEQQLFDSHPLLGYRLISNIPRLEEVAKIVQYQHKNYDGSGFPQDAIAGEQIILGARLLHLALGYDSVICSGRRGEVAMYTLRNQALLYDPQALVALQQIVENEAGFAIRDLLISELEDGMLIAEDILNPAGALLVSHGLEVNSTMKARLMAYTETGLIRNKIRARIPTRR